MRCADAIGKPGVQGRPAGFQTGRSTRRGQLEPDQPDDDERRATHAREGKRLAHDDDSDHKRADRADSGPYRVRRAERQLPLEEERRKIDETLRRERLAQRREEFTRRLRENARIEYVAP